MPEKEIVVHAVRWMSQADGLQVVQCEPEEADMFSVYLKEGDNLSLIADLKSARSAERAASVIRTLL